MKRSFSNMFLTSVLFLAGSVGLAVADGCHGDNLLRALERHNGSAYCSSFLSLATATTTLGPLHGMLTTYAPGSISSACSCLLEISSASASVPYHSRMETLTRELTASTDTDTTATSTSSSDTVSSTLGKPITTPLTFDGGYSFSFPNTRLTSSPASTSGLGDATTTVQVTETSIKTVYITSLSPMTDGDSGGRPAPPRTRTTSSSDTSSESTSSETGISAADPTALSTATSSETFVTTITRGDSTIISSITESTSTNTRGGTITQTLVVDGKTTTIVGNLPKPTSDTSSTGGSEVTSFLTYSDPSSTPTWLSSSSGSLIGPSTGTRIPSPSVTTITSDFGGDITSTWVVTAGGSSVPPFPNTTSTTVSNFASEATSGSFSVITPVLNGESSTLTMSGSSTFAESPSTDTLTTPATSSDTASGLSTVITSTVNSIPSTWTVSGGSTLVPSNSSTATPTTSNTGLVTVVTSVVDGAPSTWTLSDGSALTQPSYTTVATPTDTGSITFITTRFGGEPSTWTDSSGSSSTSPSNGTTSMSTATGPATVITTTNGFGSIWAVSDGSALSRPFTNTTTTSSSPTGPLTGATGTVNSTLPTVSTSGSASSTASASTSTISTTTTSYDSAFTGISVVAAQSASRCYATPIPTSSLHESVLNNTGRNPPYIDAFYLNTTTNTVKYVRLVDNTAAPILIDVSDSSGLTIIDKDGDALSIDGDGLHFTGANCAPNIDVLIPGFFEQLNALTNSTYANQIAIRVNGTAAHPPRRGFMTRQTNTFDVVLKLKDQCGNPARADLPVSVAFGDTQCVVLPKAPGDFVAECALPGGESGSKACETSVQQTLDHLTNGSFAGACPSSISVWSLLSQQLGKVVSLNGLLQPFLDAGLDVNTDEGQRILSIIDTFLKMYDFSTSTFRNSTSKSGSSLSQLVEDYGMPSITTDVCRSLHASETSSLTYTAGAATIPETLAQFSAPPSPPAPEYERNVTDPSGLACCTNPGRCVVEDGERFYPPETSVAGSDCLCGTTADGKGIAFRTGRCVGYGQCSTTTACAGGGVCLVDNCCGFSVCVNGTECSAPRVGRRWADLFETETLAGML